MTHINDSSSTVRRKIPDTGEIGFVRFRGADSLCSLKFWTRFRIQNGNFGNASISEFFEQLDFLRTLFNSLLISGVSVVIIIIFSAMAAYALSRNKSKISEFLIGASQNSEANHASFTSRRLSCRRHPEYSVPGGDISFCRLGIDLRGPNGGTTSKSPPRLEPTHSSAICR